MAIISFLSAKQKYKSVLIGLRVGNHTAVSLVRCGLAVPRLNLLATDAIGTATEIRG